VSNDDRRVTVADILRREGVTEELPVVRRADDTPTERIPVAELLRREGKWDRRRTAKVGAAAAGVAVLAGFAISVLSAGHSDNTTIAPLAGGAGGGPVDPTTPSSSISSDSRLLASTSPSADHASSSRASARSASTTGGQLGSRAVAAHRDTSPVPVVPPTSPSVPSPNAGSSLATSRTTTPTTTPPPDEDGSSLDDERSRSGGPGLAGSVSGVVHSVLGLLDHH
jgi:hypothetical protein